MKFLWIGLGGATGALARYLLTSFTIPLAVHRFPAGTLLVNLSGCFVAGWLWGLAMDRPFSPHLTLFLFTGLLGGYTTFSSFSLENMQLLRNGDYGLALLYIVTSTAGGLLAAWTGLRVSGHTLLG